MMTHPSENLEVMLNLKEMMEKELQCRPNVNEPTTVTIASAKEIRKVTIGSPLRTSSPTLMSMDGVGDCHSLRSVHSLLSPIRSCRATHHINYSSIESPPPTPKMTIDNFLPRFEKDSAENKSFVMDDLCPLENVQDMTDSEMRNLLEKTLLENAGLRKEVNMRDKRIAAYKGQMLAVLEWKVQQDVEGSGDGVKNIPLSFATSSMNLAEPEEKNEDPSKSQESEPSHQKNMVPQKTVEIVREITTGEEVYGIRRSLSFIHELATSIDVDQELLRHRFKDGCYLTNQMLMGALSGWMSALFVRKFGKIALSAAGGGLLLLVYTTKKGYVNVNYESIYAEISQFCDKVGGVDTHEGWSNTNGDGDYGLSKSSINSKLDFEADSEEDLEASESEHKWVVVERVRNARKWVAAHSYTVGGFCLAFVYNLI